MKEHTVYEGYDDTSPNVIWLWEVLGEFTQEEL